MDRLLWCGEGGAFNSVVSLIVNIITSTLADHVEIRNWSDVCHSNIQGNCFENFWRIEEDSNVLSFYIEMTLKFKNSCM